MPSQRPLLLLGLILALLAGSIAAPLYVRAQRERKVQACRSGLYDLWKLENIYLAAFGGPRRGRMPRQTGKDFWLHLSRMKNPMIEDPEAFFCPMREDRTAGTVHYLGPASDVMKIPDGDPVGCDEPGNHDRYGGPWGHVLYKSGDIRPLEGERWKIFHASGLCAP